MKRVVGLLGASGSGKGTFVKLLQLQNPRFLFSSIRFSDVLVETLKQWRIPATRENLQKEFTAMEESFGVGSLAKANHQRINEINLPLIVIEGVRKRADVSLLSMFPNSLLVYIHSEPQVRFDRLRKRNEKVGESTMSYAQFQKEESASTETEIATLAREASVTMYNSSTITIFEDQIKAFYREHIEALT